MILKILKGAVERLPHDWQYELRRRYFKMQIRTGRFVTEEKEFTLLDRIIKPGDWVLDVGANVGHYTNRMSQLVGPQGRVIAIEPVPLTFSLLSANAQSFPHPNVSLLNLAASDRPGTLAVEIPSSRRGANNYYQAHVSMMDTGLQVLTVAIDDLGIPNRIRLVKIDVEGHEGAVLDGLKKLLARDRPVVVLETWDKERMAWLKRQGWDVRRLADSSNVLCVHTDDPVGEALL